MKGLIRKNIKAGGLDNVNHGAGYFFPTEHPKSFCKVRLSVRGQQQQLIRDRNWAHLSISLGGRSQCS